MNHWFIHSLVAVFAIGVLMGLYKVPAARGHNKVILSFLGFAIATAISFIFFRSSVRVDPPAILYGALWGTGYALLTMMQMELLKRLDTNAFFPLTSVLSQVLVVLLGIFFFHDILSPLQFVGVGLAIFVVGFYNWVHEKISLQNGLLFSFAAIVLLSTGNKFVQKFGSVSVESKNFIFWQLFFAMVAALCIFLFTQIKEREKTPMITRAMLLWALAIGILNFIGTAEIVKALAIGPFSLVYAINSFYVVIASLVGWRFFGEKLTRRKVIFFLLGILTVILIRIG